jgi:hypothetical protein
VIIKTYTNENYPVRFDYPANWYFYEKPNLDVHTILADSIEASDFLYFEIFCQNLEEGPICFATDRWSCYVNNESISFLRTFNFLCVRDHLMFISFISNPNSPQNPRCQTVVITPTPSLLLHIS